MSDFTELIMSRRSVRKHKEAQIPEESLQAILKTGIYAPNGGNTQNVAFHSPSKSEYIKRTERVNKKSIC